MSFTDVYVGGTLQRRNDYSYQVVLNIPPEAGELRPFTFILGVSMQQIEHRNFLVEFAD